MIIPNEIKTLFNHFEDGYISADWNFNLHNSSVQLPLNAIDHEYDIAHVLIAFASHEIAFGSAQPLPILNFFHRESLRLKVNRFLRIKLSQKQYKAVSEAVGYGADRLTIAQNFVKFGYDMDYIYDIISDSEIELVTT